MNLKDLENKYNDWKRQRSNLPEHALPLTRLRDASEKDLKQAIRCHCQLQGWSFTSYDAKGFFDWRTGSFIPSKNDKGRGDGLILIPVKLRKMTVSHTVWFDVKIGRDYQKKNQKRFQAEAEAAGADYILVKSWEDYFQKITTITNDIQAHI